MAQMVQLAPAKMPLVAFEHYMLADERKSHSMACHMRFWFTGHFVQSDFEGALRRVLIRHPVFQMTVEGPTTNKTNEIYWVAKSSVVRACLATSNPESSSAEQAVVMPFISWGELGTPIDTPLTGATMDLHTEIGIRFWIRQSNSESTPKTVLLIQFHHSACDGLGIIQFMDDLLMTYGQLRGSCQLTCPMIDPTAFNLRGTHHLDQEKWAARTSLDWRRTLKYFMTIPTPMLGGRPPRPPKCEVSDALASERIVLPKNYLDRYRENARLKNVSVNDLLIRDLFLSLADWNRSQRKTCRIVRLALAVSLRVVGDSCASAANNVSMVFLDRSARKIRRSDLLQSISNETKEIMSFRMGLSLIRVLKRLGSLRYLMAFVVRLPVCSSTAVLTNVGHVFSNSKLMGTNGKVSLGDISLESLELLAPVRPKTNAAFSINYYAGELSITMRFNSLVMTTENANQFLNQFSSRIKDCS